MRRLLFLLPVLLASCDLDTTYFDDYAGLNLISNYDFNITGDWNLLSNAVPLTFDDDYMRYELASAGTGPSGSDVYRLEIKNLFPNGDFEAGLGGFWELNDAGPANASRTIINTDDPSPTFPTMQRTIRAGDRALKIVTDDPDDYVGFNVSTANFGPGIVVGGTFMVRFSFRNFRWFPVQYYRLDGTYSDHQTVFLGFGTSNSIQLDPTFPTLETFPGNNLLLPFTMATGTHRINFGFNSAADNPGAPSSNSQVTILDDVRLFRTDLDSWLELQVPTLTSTSLELLPGIYEFRIWVSQEEAAAVSPTSPVAWTRFRAPGITIEWQAQVAGGTQTVNQYYPDSGWAGWTQLTLRAENVQFEPDTFNPASPAIRIRLSPNRMNGSFSERDTGSLLIARPELFFLER